MKKLPLTQGKFALVDNDDFKFLSAYKWYARFDGLNYYAVRNGRYTKYGRVPIQMHRVIINASKGMFVDHINHNGLDNRKKNLRLCNKAENCRNQKIRANKTSQYKGVHLYKGTGRNFAYRAWRASISFEGRCICIGDFKLESVAALAYNKKAKELFGEFAYLNKLKSRRKGVNKC